MIGDVRLAKDKELDVVRPALVTSSNLILLPVNKATLEHLLDV